MTLHFTLSIGADELYSACLIAMLIARSMALRMKS